MAESTLTTPRAGTAAPSGPRTPASRLASKDFGVATAEKPNHGTWLAGTLIGWAVFVGFLGFIAWLLLALVRVVVWAGDLVSLNLEPLGNIVALVLILVMIFATLLTMADRKWSALMQDRVGPNRARINLPGIRNMELKGLPHILADVLKMLFKEDFISQGSLPNKFLFNLAPLLAFAPAFCLFAIVPVGPPVAFFGKVITLQVARVDWGILYVFALASIGVFGTALAGWTSNNKLALLGGLRASAQLVSYEVTLGLTLVGSFIVFGTLRLDEMVAAQGMAGDALAQVAGTHGLADTSLLFGWLPAWGVFYQPLGMLLFLVAAMAEIKRAPFDTPEGESEIIGYFLEYSGLKSGLFLIAEYAETVVVAGIIVSIFLGGYHLPWIEPALYGRLDGLFGIGGGAWLAVLQVFSFIVKMLAVVWLMFLIRWAFPRFRYDQIMRLGWKMMLPVALVNVMLSAGVFLWGGREGLAWMGILEWVAMIAFILFSARPASTLDGKAHSGAQGQGHDFAHAAAGSPAALGTGAHDAHSQAAASHGPVPTAHAGRAP